MAQCVYHHQRTGEAGFRSIRLILDFCYLGGFSDFSDPLPVGFGPLLKVESRDFVRKTCHGVSVAHILGKALGS